MNCTKLDRRKIDALLIEANVRDAECPATLAELARRMGCRADNLVHLTRQPWSKPRTIAGVQRGLQSMLSREVKSTEFTSRVKASQSRHRGGTSTTKGRVRA